MNASRPSRPTNAYLASGNIGMPSAGVCVLMKRRCRCAARRPRISSIGSNSASSQGDISSTGPGTSPSGERRLATIVCIQVVPHFAGVQTKMSSGRGVKPAQRRLSATAVR
jgi:hypothetical protein